MSNERVAEIRQWKLAEYERVCDPEPNEHKTLLKALGAIDYLLSLLPESGVAAISDELISRDAAVKLSEEYGIRKRAEHRTEKETLRIDFTDPQLRFMQGEAAAAEVLADRIRRLPAAQPSGAGPTISDAIAKVEEMQDTAERITLTTTGYERDTWITRIVVLRDVVAVLESIQSQGDDDLSREMERDAMIDTINVLHRERDQAIDILKVALAETRWHDDGRRLIADVEDTNTYAVIVSKGVEDREVKCTLCSHRYGIGDEIGLCAFQLASGLTCACKCEFPATGAEKPECGTSFKDFLREQLKDPEFAAAYREISAEVDAESAGAEKGDHRESLLRQLTAEHPHIRFIPGVLGGVQPLISRTRVGVEHLLGRMAIGMSIEEYKATWHFTDEMVRDAFAYAQDVILGLIDREREYATTTPQER